MGTRLEKNSNDVRKRIENHDFVDEEGEEYNGSKFGGFADYMRRKKIKLQNLDAEIRSQSTQNLQIFRNIVVHVNGYTQPSLSDLHKLVVSHGGGFLQYLDGKTECTHVVASHLTPKKKVEFAKYRAVKPAWIVDSVKAGKLLPWDGYRVVDEGVTQKVLGFDNGQIISQASTQRLGYRDQTDTSWYTTQMRSQAELTPKASASTFISPAKSSSKTSKFGYDARGIPAILDGPSDVHRSPAQDRNDDSELESLDDSDDEGELIKPDRPPPQSEASTTAIPQGDTGDDPNAESKFPEKRQLTAEEHNAILLSNPHLAKSSTANPDFLNQYYRESRLHHLSTWKADLKAQLQARAMEKASSQKSGPKRAPGSRRYIMHVDFDSFFAAVSLRKNPHLAGKPVVIAHGSGPGSEIASCNYPARKFGVKNGMWMKSALALCPDLKVLPYDFKLYEEASRHFYDSILAMDGVVQSISIDEALLDVTDLCLKAGGSDGRGVSEGSIYREQEKAEELAQTLRQLIREKTGCDVSVGMGDNILLAKVALRKAKPAGQHLIKPEDMLAFLGDLSVTDLPGVAWSIGKKLEEIGISYVKDIRELSKERLMNHLGPKTGEKIWDYSRGIDKQEVGEQVVRKSVSAEINWGIRFINQQQAEDFVQCLCDELSKRLNEQLVKGRQLTTKIMRKAADAGMDPPKNLGHGKCDTFNKSIILGVATTDSKVIGKEAISILRSYGFPPGELRGLGVQMQKLEPLKGSGATVSTLVDSSQRRLQFKKPTMPTVTDSSKRSSMSTGPSPTPARSRSKLTDTLDTIEDVTSPRKDQTSKSIQRAIQATSNWKMSEPNQRPLNVTGTQFILPSQIDPSVLAELPADIRSKLAPKQKSIFDSIARPNSPHNLDKSRSASPQVSDGETGLPNQSQLDQATLAELPEEVRQELLAHYRNNKVSNARAFQQVLPQSPRKVRPVSSKKLVVTPTKKQKFSSLATKGRSKTNQNSTSTLTQSNFVSMPKVGASTEASAIPVDEEISLSFLEELPEDIRMELLAEQKRNRMKAKSGLNVGTSRKRARVGASEGDSGRGQQTLALPRLPPKPTFTSRKLSTLPELREAMEAWVEEFSEGDEGPYEEDINALGQYLGKVIVDEGDMEKAVSAFKWLQYVLDLQQFPDSDLSSAWANSMAILKGFIQTAVSKRGLPPVDIG
jgi:DNA repair protein REV1